ncbi:hypothetical protein [Guptibacillus hwajinpoensis]|uniref:Spore coat protein n=1 Tax=Guptibacillus hwajinpoensis TaxID=208199 RepID=A0A0J6FYK0_9BACL|nr:hypothetical protein [Alkalihalobacillus macyae]KMM39452.1 hypothetical protein AB986_09740 [Alkalihalobacillus macyae]
MTNFKVLEGKQVQINLKGPESKSGSLLSVKDDHLVLLSENGVIYYNLTHVKSITKNSTANSEQNHKKSYLKKGSFEDVLSAMHHKWVKINRGGPEHTEGVLVGLQDDHILLIKERELIHISMFHIKSVSVGE